MTEPRTPDAYRALEVLRFLQDYARREPWSGLHAQHPGRDLMTDVIVGRAARALRSQR